MECPECGGEFHTTWGPSHPLIIHWKANPGLAFNELLLGQRLPEVFFICSRCWPFKPNGQWAVCDKCDRAIPGMFWSRGNSFGHWVGLICPFCLEPIRAIENWTSRTIRFLTTPLRFLLDRAIGDRLLSWSRARARRALEGFTRQNLTLTGRKARIGKGLSLEFHESD